MNTSFVKKAVILGISYFCCANSFASENPASYSKEPLLKRSVPDKSRAHTYTPQTTEGANIIVKFKEGSGIFLQGEQLQISASSKISNTLTLAQQDLPLIQQALGKEHKLQPMFNLPRKNLNALKASGQEKSGKQLADLSLYFISPWQNASRNELISLIKQLNALDTVEIAYVQPQPEEASTNTPNLRPNQGYLDSDTNGIYANAAWAFEGGRGKHVKIIDVERGWETEHEDLPTPFHIGGTIYEPSKNHGTAVAGVMVAQDNTYGVTGIVPNAAIGYESWFGRSVAQAITSATAELEPGDIILIEVHARGPETVTCDCNFSQCNYLPMEFWQAEFDAIQTATANGLIVVEAGGNGSVNLDHPEYANAFNRDFRDSGAILVGASVSNARAPACFTNHGTRIDLHGWGRNVTTTGYGDAYQGNPEGKDKYTFSFSGTSSASPIVAGSVAALQSISVEQDGIILSAAQVRDLLVDTGTPQTSASSDKLIGPLPNLAAAIENAGWEEEQNDNDDNSSLSCNLGDLSASGGWYSVGFAGITNTGDTPIQGWTLQIEGFAPAVPSIAWNWNLGNYSVEGSTILLEGDETIAPGATFNFGFGGPYSGSNSVSLSCKTQ